MATLNPTAVQNEDIQHMPRGKGVEGAKLGTAQNENIHLHKGLMATLNPTAVQNEDIQHMPRGKGVEGAKLGTAQNENIHLHKEKGIELFKAEKPKPLKHKGLGDLLHAGNPSSSTSSTENKGAAVAAVAKFVQTRESYEEELEYLPSLKGMSEKSYEETLLDEEMKECVDREVAMVSECMRTWNKHMRSVLMFPYRTGPIGTARLTNQDSFKKDYISCCPNPLEYESDDPFEYESDDPFDWEGLPEKLANAPPYSEELEDKIDISTVGDDEHVRIPPNKRMKLDEKCKGDSEPF